MAFNSLDEWMDAFSGGYYYAEWTDFIYGQLLSTSPIALKDIYNKIKDRYPEICVDYIQYWGNPKWMHMVRSILDGLMKKGLAQSIGRGWWVKLR